MKMLLSECCFKSLSQEKKHQVEWSSWIVDFLAVTGPLKSLLYLFIFWHGDSDLYLRLRMPLWPTALRVWWFACPEVSPGLWEISLLEAAPPTSLHFSVNKKRREYSKVYMLYSNHQAHINFWCFIDMGLKLILHIIYIQKLHVQDMLMVWGKNTHLMDGFTWQYYSILTLMSWGEAGLWRAEVSSTFLGDLLSRTFFLTTLRSRFLPGT